MTRLWLALLWTWWWAGWVVMLLVMAVTEWTGIDPERDYELALGGVVFAAIAAALAGTGVRMIRNLRPDPATPPRAPVVERRPPAHGHLAGLAEAEAALTELLGRLATQPGMSAYVVDHLWRTSTDKAAALRALDPGDAFDEGLDDYRRLIATTGQLLLGRTP